MSSLKEKAKTLPEIEKEYLEFVHKDENIRNQQKRKDEFNKIRWVKKED